mmetsp:Transcript_9358/g.14191  ORF Transcript_9358/g.14191 Transcript_9358/m.14191 type:complete len:179 (-) Transcript_9358:1317-1853(-)
MNFTFADKPDSSDAAKRITSRMHLFDDSNMKDMIRSKYIVDEPDFSMIEKFMAELTKPDNLLIFLSSHSFKGQLKDKEYWYKTSFKSAPFSDQLLNKIRSPSCDVSVKSFGMPPPNTLIPKDFTVLDKMPEFSQEPRLVKRWPGCTDLWYKKDDRFETPKVDIVANIYTKDLLFSMRP